MSLADRVRADIQQKQRTKCTTCKAIIALSAEDRATFDEYMADPAIPRASIARAIGIQPERLTDHVAAGHDVPR